MSAVEVASLFATLSLNDTMTAGLQNAGREVNGLGDSLRRIGGAVSNVGTQLTVMTAPIAGAFLGGLSTAASFEESLAEVEARAGLTSDELARVSDFALQMGADTAFSGQQALDAFLQLLTSGQSVEQAFSTLPSVLTAAAASGADLGMTADAVTDIMSAFGLSVENVTPEMQALFDAAGLTNEMIASIVAEGDSGVPILNQLAEQTGLTAQALYDMIASEDAASVVDTLARAAGASSADISDLMQGMGNVAPVARMFRMNVNQTAAALAVLSENGVKGAEAGTLLKSVLTNMNRDTEDVVSAWNELGISLYDTEGNIRDLPIVLDELKVALEVLPVEDQIRLMSDLGGSYGVVGLSALTGAMSIHDMEAAMAGAASAQEVADARMSTFNMTLDSLRGSVETLAIRALTPLMDNVLRPLAERGMEVVNAITRWVQLNPELTGQIVGLLVGAVLLGPALTVVGTALKLLAAPLGIVSGLFTLLISPVGLVLSGFLGIMALGGQLESWFSDLKGILGPAAETGLFGLQTAFKQITSGQTELGLMTLGTSLAVIGDALKQTATVTLDNFVTSLENLTGLDLRGPLDDIGNFITTVAGLADQFVIQPIVEGLEGLAAGAEQFVNTLVADVDPAALQGIIDFLGKLGAAIGALVGGVLAIGGKAIGETLGAVGDALPGLASGVADLINTVGGLLNGSIDPAQALNDIGTALGSIGTTLLKIPMDVLDGLITFLNDALGIDLPSLEEIWAGIQGALEPVRDAAQGFIDVLEGAWIVLKPMLQPIVDWFNTTFAGIGAEGGAISEIERVWGELQTALTSLWATVQPVIEPMVAWFNSTFLGIKTNVIDPIVVAIQNIVAAVDSALKALGILGGGGGVDAYTGGVLPEYAGFNGNTFAAQELARLEGKAIGGPVGAGRPYIVGEKGAELFVPSSNGTIIPNNALGGGRQPVVINLTTIGTNERDVADFLLRALRDRGI